MKIRVSRRRRNGGAGGAATERTKTPRSTCTPRVQKHITRLVVEVANCASAWRDAAVDAELAFGWWKNAGQVDRAKAAALYLAAIEREEKAAQEYARAVEVCSRTVPRARP
jgi:hypothetical protein